MMQSNTKQKIISNLIATSSIQGIPERDVSEFATLLLDRMPITYLEKLTESDLEKIVAHSMTAFRQPLVDGPTVIIQQETVSFHKTPRLFLSLINIDRPYLIDSLQSFLTRWNLRSQILLHPVFGVERDDNGLVKKIHNNYREITQGKSPARFESIIFIMAKYKFSDSELIHFEADLRRMLQQLCWAVDDQVMLEESLGRIKSHLNNKDVINCFPEDSKDAFNFLEWLQNKYFLFLGGRYFKIDVSDKNNSFICLEDPEIDKVTGLFRDELIASADDLAPAIARVKIIPDQITTPHSQLPLLTVIKTSYRSTIHRMSRLDSVEVINFSEEGRIKGVYQFIGMFKKELFNISAFDIPWLQRKAQAVFDKFNVDPSWYVGKTLISILDSIPRDEMFYHDENQLTAICRRVLELQEHAGEVAVFTRHDLYGRYLTIMVYLPRERYSFSLKEKLGQIVSTELKGVLTSSVAQVGDLPYARIIFVLNFSKPQHIDVDIQALETTLSEASLSWMDRFDKYIDTEINEEISSQTIGAYRQGFPITYQDKFKVEEAFADILTMEALLPQKAVDLKIYESKTGQIKVKIFHVGDALSLAALLPILSNLGIRVLSETTYNIKKSDTNFHIHDFEIQVESNIDWRRNQIYLRLAFQDIWSENTENDGFNQLILRSGLTVRQVTLLRAYSKYLLQIKLPYSQGYIESTLAQYPVLSALLVEFFEGRFQVNREGMRSLDQVEHDFIEQLQDVFRLDHDRILRRLLNVLKATVRTNYYQLDKMGVQKDYISFKFFCRDLEDLPQPRPLYEIYVYSPYVEAIHSRGGKVARGGLRWSDRFEDYRTEILGLLKAQMVKNSVIVPLGSKGGFIVKKQHQFADRNDLQQEVIRCYQIMIQGLLDVTDNVVGGRIVTPPQVIRYDEDDPYLVVAADKGTATFSDIANAISQEYGFWLDDAFASGGSAGYDHKKMAITSSGAWESVKRHFREMGRDIQTEPFTVIGVGDMSGDVFGNGMLRSKKIRLIAAFDHRHIFVDPNPDENIAFAERERIFQLQRSSWMDYNPELISKGGGVFSRTEKAIQLSPEIQGLFGLSLSQYTPDDFIRILMQHEVDLLWFGGIGTFVKASSESNLEVGDLVNQNLRVDAKKLRAKVIGEGANLGMTQLARVEYALSGGRLNTDAIDNSAGVDCSDHEVNIKILFNALPQKILTEKRDEILRQMTDEVAQLVLQDNYHQTQILSIMQAGDMAALYSYQSLMRILEVEASLNRSIEFLPDDEQIERRRTKNQGMTRPELAVLLAYSKIHLYNQLLASNEMDKKLYKPLLISYFPRYLQRHFKEAIVAHPLYREIIATVLANEMINKVGPTFTHEIVHASGSSVSKIVEAFFTIVQLFNLNELWQAIDSLDSKMITHVQIHAYQQIAQILRVTVLHMLRGDIISTPNQEIIQKLVENLPQFLSPIQADEVNQKIESLIIQGVDKKIAMQLASISLLPSLLEIASVITTPVHENVLKTAEAYFNVKASFGIDWLESMVHQLTIETDWQRSAQLSLINDLGIFSTFLLKQVLENTKSGDVVEWLDQNQNQRIQVQALMANLRTAYRPDFGLLSFLVRQLQQAV